MCSKMTKGKGAVQITFNQFFMEDGIIAGSVLYKEWGNAYQRRKGKDM